MTYLCTVLNTVPSNAIIYNETLTESQLSTMARKIQYCWKNTGQVHFLILLTAMHWAPKNG